MRPNSSPSSEATSHVRALYADLIEAVFSGVLRRDAAILAELHGFGRSFYFADGCWHFTLPDLFAFLLARYQDGMPSIAQADIAYTSFRRMLYGEPTNAELRRRGGIVEVAHVHKNHAFTVYKLKPIGTQDGLALSNPEP